MKLLFDQNLSTKLVGRLADVLENRESIMGSTNRRYSKEEFAKRGDAIWDKEVLPHLKTGDKGKFAAIDIESGAYEIDNDEMEAGDKLRARIPDAQIWIVRIGSRYVHRLMGISSVD